MRVSQVLHKMGKDETVAIFDSGLPIDKHTLYHGPVRGVHRDSPLLRLGVDMIMACDDEIIIDVGRKEHK